MEFNDFLNRYKNEALQVDLKKEQLLAYEILELKKMKLNGVTFDYEIDEVIAFCEKAITETKETLNRTILNEHYKRTYKSGIPLFLSQMKAYFEYLELYRNAIAKKKEPQQPETVKPDEVKKELHNDIFKYNAFEVFEVYKENKQINVNSRTDLRVIFELLKGDNLLLKTIELKHYIDWLNRVYYKGNITELKKQNLNSKPNIVRTNDYNEYKKTTLKQP